jgi:hypothetical protein
MELIKNNNRNSALFQKFANLKYSSYVADKDLTILRSLRDDNNFIKKKLISIETKYKQANQLIVSIFFLTFIDFFSISICFKKVEKTKSKSSPLIQSFDTSTNLNKEEKSEKAIRKMKKRLLANSQNETLLSKIDG